MARQDRRAKTVGALRFATRSISLSDRTDGISVSKAWIVLPSGSTGRYSTPPTLGSPLQVFCHHMHTNKLAKGVRVDGAKLSFVQPNQAPALVEKVC